MSTHAKVRETLRALWEKLERFPTPREAIRRRCETIAARNRWPRCRANGGLSHGGS